MFVAKIRHKCTHLVLLIIKLSIESSLCRIRSSIEYSLQHLSFMRDVWFIYSIERGGRISKMADMDTVLLKLSSLLWFGTHI